jgi:hypothetical protein
VRAPTRAQTPHLASEEIKPAPAQPSLRLPSHRHACPAAAAAAAHPTAAACEPLRGKEHHPWLPVEGGRRLSPPVLSTGPSSSPAPEASQRRVLPAVARLVLSATQLSAEGGRTPAHRHPNPPAHRPSAGRPILPPTKSGHPRTTPSRHPAKVPPPPLLSFFVGLG